MKPGDMKETLMQAPVYDPWLNAHRSGYMRDGFAARYDASSPTPAPALLALLCQFIQTPALRLVVDLGSGTGLSTAVWADRAQQVIGIEPQEAMRRAVDQTLGRTGRPWYVSHHVRVDVT
jgi:protein-L-isoaspartate O-methyltransferase